MTTRSTVRRDSEGGESRRDEEPIIDRLARIRAVREEAAKEERAIEREIAEGRVDSLFDKVADLVERETGVMVKNDSVQTERTKKYVETILQFGARAIRKGTTKRAEEFASNLIGSLRE